MTDPIRIRAIDIENAYLVFARTAGGLTATLVHGGFGLRFGIDAESEDNMRKFFAREEP